MKPLSIAVAMLTTVIAVGACKNRKEEPIPGPKAVRAAAEAITTLPGGSPSGKAPGSEAVRPDSDRHGASGISWFQGTVEEGFSTACSKCTTMLLREAREALDR